MNKCIVCGLEITTKKLCSNPKCKSEHSRRTIQSTFKRHGEITRFRKTNGMKDPKTREKVSTKLRAMGWRPVIHGGNGRPHPVHQTALAAALGWQMEVVIPTGLWRGSGYPTCYKADIGNPVLKIAIEVDGGSHNSIGQMAKDKKKTEFLESKGWKVLRFKNKTVETDILACVAEVLSII